MNKRILPALAILSTATIALLILGCFIRMEMQVVFVSSRGTAGDAGVALDGGRMRLEAWHAPSTGRPFRFHIDFREPKIRMPDAKRLLCEFDARSWLTGFGDRATFLECPVWVGLLPCLIAPIAWLRRRRQKPSRGFAVLNPK